MNNEARLFSSAHKSWAIRLLLASVFASIFAPSMAPLIPSFLPSVLLHLAIMGLFVDLYRKSHIKAVLLIPLAAYTAYYAYYWYEGQLLAPIEADMKSHNPAKIDFNAQAENLVMYVGNLVTKDTDKLVTTARFPVIYKETFDKKYTSHRLVSPQRCKEIGYLQTVEALFWFHRSDMDSRLKNFCTIELEEKPSGNNLTFSHNVSYDEVEVFGLPMHLGEYKFSRNGNEIGVLHAAYFQRLSLIPSLEIHCKEGCGLGFSRHTVELDTVPDSPDKAKYGENPVARILGVDAYTDDDIEHFQDEPRIVSLSKCLSEKHGTQDQSTCYLQPDNSLPGIPPIIKQ